MAKSKRRVHRRNSLPEDFKSLDEFWTFWDAHSTADYEELMEDVDAHVAIGSSRIYCAVAKDIVAELHDRARQHGVSTETLINLWLREKVAEAREST